MRNVLILGSGRSGTSLTAGLLHEAGYFCGASLLPPGPANPRGFFEDRLVNHVNERIMVERVPVSRPARIVARLLGRPAFDYGQLWLAALDGPFQWRTDPLTRLIIELLVSRQPFAYKDPRFAYTLPAWRSLLPDCAFICVFREPLTTVASIVKEVASEPGYRDLRIGEGDVLRMWKAMYRSILDQQRPGADWLFVEFAELVSGAALPALSAFVGASLPGALRDTALARTQSPPAAADEESAGLHRQLQQLATDTQRAALARRAGSSACAS